MILRVEVLLAVWCQGRGARCIHQENIYCRAESARDRLDFAPCILWPMTLASLWQCHARPLVPAMRSRRIDKPGKRGFLALYSSFAVIGARITAARRPEAQ